MSSFIGRFGNSWRHAGIFIIDLVEDEMLDYLSMLSWPEMGASIRDVQTLGSHVIRDGNVRVCVR